MKTRAASTRTARSDGKGKKEEGEGKNTQRSTLNSQLSTATGNLKPQPAPVQGEVLPVPPAEIGPSPYQTRAAETAEDLAGLAASIAASGLLNPLTVRRAGPDAPSGVRWELVCGHRRLAAGAASMNLIPAAALLLVYRTGWGSEKWQDRAERLGQARRLTPESAARAFLECAASRMEPWIDKHRYLTQEAYPENYIGEAEALAGIFGLDEADIAAKIAEAGAADGDD